MLKDNRYVDFGNQRSYNYERRHKHIFKLVLVVSFFIILIFLIFTSFFKNPSLTGEVVSDGGEANKNIYGDGIYISADLTVPGLFIKEKLDKIKIKGVSGSFLYLENQKISLSDSKKISLVLEGYEGEFFINRSRLEIDGKISKILVGDVPITSKVEGDSGLKIIGDLRYSSLEINSISIPSLDYLTSGKIEVDGETVIDIENERVISKNFVGNMKVAGEHFKLNGAVESLKITGEKDISFSLSS